METLSPFEQYLDTNDTSTLPEIDALNALVEEPNRDRYNRCWDCRATEEA